MGTDDPDGQRGPDYRVARIVAAGTLILVVAFAVVFDALSPDYDASPFVLTVLLGSALTLLGIEGLAFLRGGK